MKDEKDQVQLPENAFRELKEGEDYDPVMSPQKEYPGSERMERHVGNPHGRAVFCCSCLSRTEGRTGL